MADVADPRPLTGEPLALDLVDTVWLDDRGTHDLLDDPAQRSSWLARWDLPDPGGRSAAANLAATRQAIRRLLEHPDDPAAAEAIDLVLGRGRIRLTFQDRRPGEAVDVAPAWEAAWHAARDLRRLLAERPDRVKHCANPDCVLWFDDTTRSGTRRWCSMAACGNRLKARRHYERRQTDAKDDRQAADERA
jgi:predicted RNA-binding Zn ribbon-like protein